VLTCTDGVFWCPLVMNVYGRLADFLRTERGPLTELRLAWLARFGCCGRTRPRSFVTGDHVGQDGCRSRSRSSRRARCPASGNTPHLGWSGQPRSGVANVNVRLLSWRQLRDDDSGVSPQLSSGGLHAPSRVENSQSPTAAIASPTDPARSSSSERDTARTICSLFPVDSR